MIQNRLRVIAGMLTGAMLAALIPAEVSAAPLAGISEYTENVMTVAGIPNAGIAQALTKCMIDGENQAIMASAQPQVSENDTPVVSSEYADIAVATVTDYVNIRSEADEDSEKVGKLYADGVATVLAAEGNWYQIESGSVKGYVCADYVTVGDEALIKSVGRRIATVTTETLKVRTGAGTDYSVLSLVPEGDDLTVIDESKDGWVGVTVGEGTGYVSAEYVTLSTEYSYAESKEEEEARLKKEEEARAAAAAASSSSSGSSGTSVSKGQAVANYACQFVGNPYVYGGTSLTNGADCSGFVMSVYAHFGISLPHSSSALRSVGYAVSVSEMKPGDIVCYSGHVAIYIGNNTIVHASNSKDGIKYTSPVNYTKILAVRRIF